MKNYTVEELDKSRYNMILWLTIGWGIWYGSIIMKITILNSPLIDILSVIGGVSWVIWVIGLVKMVRLNKILKTDKALNTNLNDEVVLHNRLRSFQIGYLSFGITTLAMLFASGLSIMSIELACKIIIYFGVLSTLIAWLIYNKN